MLGDSTAVLPNGRGDSKLTIFGHAPHGNQLQYQNGSFHDSVPAVLVYQTVRALALSRYGSIVARHYVLRREVVVCLERIN